MAVEIEEFASRIKQPVVEMPQVESPSSLRISGIDLRSLMNESPIREPNYLRESVGSLYGYIFSPEIEKDSLREAELDNIRARRATRGIIPGHPEVAPIISGDRY